MNNLRSIFKAKLLVLVWIISVENCESIQKISIPSAQSARNTNQNELDSSQLLRLTLGPKVLFKPKIIVPDSMLPIKKDVKVLVRVEIDSAGVATGAKILKSEDNKFNQLALQYAVLYRFKIDFVWGPEVLKSVWIPILFSKQEQN